MIVLDTNVVSELMRPRPEARVLAWLDEQPVGALVTTAVTVAETRVGLARLPTGSRREGLVRIADAVLARFARRTFAFDVEAAGRYGAIVADRERHGRPIDVPDAQIAAICVTHDARLATRNTRDFDGTGVVLVDPWQHRDRR